MSLNRLITAVNKLLNAPRALTIGTILFTMGLIGPYMLSLGLPVSYDLETHYHMSYRLLNGLWDPSWSAGVTTIDYPPGAFVLAGEFTALFTFIFGNPYFGFKIFYYLVFFASLASVYFLARTFTPSQSRAGSSLLLFATAPGLARALFAGWLTVMTAFFFMTVGLALFHRFRKNRKSSTGFISGLLFALASTAHPYGIVVALLLIVPTLVYDTLSSRFTNLGNVGEGRSLKAYVSVFGGLALCAPGLIPFLTFVQATGSQAPIPHVSRNGTLLDVSNYNIIQPLGPFLIAIVGAAIALGLTRWRTRIYPNFRESSGLVPYTVFCAILLWIGAAPQGGLDAILPYSSWLVYDVFIMFVLPFAAIFASAFLSNLLNVMKSSPKRHTIVVEGIVLLALVTVPLGFLPILPPPFGGSLGSTYNLPTNLSAYLSREVAQGQWGRLLALGASSNIYDLPDINQIPIIDNNYPTGRLENFLRSSGIDDFNTARNYANGTNIIQYALANYQLFGIKWILVADPFYDAYIPKGIFQLSGFNYQDNNPPVNAKLYETAPLLTPFDGAINSTYESITQTGLQLNQQLTLGGSAVSGSVANTTSGGISLTITTTGSGQPGSGDRTLPFAQSNLAGGATLMLQVRSLDNSSFEGSFVNELASRTIFAKSFPVNPSWQWLKFSLPNSTAISSVTVGVVGNRTSEMVDVGSVAIGYPAISVSNTAGGITVDRGITPADDLVIKQSYTTLLKSDAGQIYQTNGGLIGLHLALGTKTVNISMDRNLYPLQFLYPNILVLFTILSAAIAFWKPLSQNLKPRFPNGSRSQLRRNSDQPSQLPESIRGMLLTGDPNYN